MRRLVIGIVAIGLLVIGCKGSKPSEPVAEGRPDSIANPWASDCTYYGLICDGFSDSFLMVLPPDASDPLRLNIERAKEAGKVYGKMRVGDAIALIFNENDSSVVDYALNLDELKSTWTYDEVAKFDTARFKPVQVGFTLKRNNQLDNINLGMSLMNRMPSDAPKPYEDHPRYMSWHLVNGALIFERNKQARDTAYIQKMERDSLVLEWKKGAQVYIKQRNN